ncbi:acyltransferase [Pseudomonas sp. 91RF]|uniref:acyltransferase family protein n=1 Tax=Pseudomonas sp. 91RF TaxID=2292261 RepID=UPI001314ECB0|nr:acyltransferase [Pseudomonas sp. 91RF]
MAGPTKETNTKSSTFRPEIDGLRALAVIAVLCSHWIIGFTFPVNWGLAGVYLFFVISGYVITRGLLKEQARNSGRISLKRFFKNRALRIWPAYFLIIVLLYFIWPGFKQEDVAWHALFLSNFLFSSPGATLFPIHFWSLSIEQQYYLFWPLLLVFMRSRLWMICLLMIILSPVARWYYADIQIPLAAIFSLPANLDCLAAGSLLAILETKMPASALKKVTGLTGALSAMLLLVILYLSSQTIAFAETIFLATSFAGLSVWMISWLNERNAKKFLLTTPVIQYIGQISYGIYLYHLMVGFCMANYLPQLSHPFLHPLLSAITTVAIAALSWRFVEKPFLLLKAPS